MTDKAKHQKPAGDLPYHDVTSPIADLDPCLSPFILSGWPSWRPTGKPRASPRKLGAPASVCTGTAATRSKTCFSALRMFCKVPSMMQGLVSHKGQRKGGALANYQCKTTVHFLILQSKWNCLALRLSPSNGRGPLGNFAKESNRSNKIDKINPKVGCEEAVKPRAFLVGVHDPWGQGSNTQDWYCPEPQTARTKLIAKHIHGPIIRSAVGMPKMRAKATACLQLQCN